MAVGTTFITDEAFPLHRVNREDRRFMSREDMEAWDQQVETLMVEIAQHGQMAPVGIAKLAGEYRYVVVYGFTRTEAVSRLGWPTIRANLYEDLDETTACLLNAGDNAWHIQLTDWERALQLQKLRAKGIPVESANGGPALTRLFGMSKRTVFNWLGLVTYPCRALHQAMAEKKLGLQHALIFRDYDPAITEAWIQRCIDGEWSSRELKIRLSAVDTLAAPDEPPPASATLHGPLSSEPMSERATLHASDEAVDQPLVKAGRWLLQVSSEQIRQLETEEQQKLKTGLRMVLEVIARMKAD